MNPRTPRFVILLLVKYPHIEFLIVSFSSCRGIMESRNATWPEHSSSVHRREAVRIEHQNGPEHNSLLATE